MSGCPYKKNKYLIQCKYCGYLLLKTKIIAFLQTEIKCPKCKKMLKLPEDVVITLEKKKTWQVFGKS